MRSLRAPRVAIRVYDQIVARKPGDVDDDEEEQDSYPWGEEEEAGVGFT